MSASTRWTVAIVVLLAGNVTALVALATAATTSTAQIIPDYYDRAAQYDEELDEATRSVATGWTTDVHVARGTVAVTVQDAAGRLLDGAVVRVSGYPRAHAVRTLDVALLAHGEGRYGAHVDALVSGAFDLRIVVERAGQRYARAANVEVP